MADPDDAAPGAEAERLVETVGSRRPEVLALATVASAAAVVEPALLRRLRLELLPGLGVGVEARLWFSPLVEHTSAQAMTFRLPVADVLRRYLGAREDRGRARAIVEEDHAGHAAVIRFEERLIWETVLGQDPAPLLAQVRSTIRTRPDQALDVLRWYRQASRRIPRRVTDSDLGRELADLARLNLDRRVPASVLEADAFPRGSGRLFDVRVPDVAVRVGFGGATMTLTPAAAGEPSTVPVPATVPPVVEAQWVTSAGEVRTRLLRVDRAAGVVVGRGTAAVTLRTLQGNRFRVRAAPTTRPTREPRRVYLSATRELDEFPADGSFLAAARRAVERTGWIVVDMGTWTASQQPPADVVRDRLAGSDVFVGVLGFRRGVVVRDDPERSYSELEFDRAGELDLPRVMFLISEEVQAPRAFFVDPDGGRAQQAFRQRVMDSPLVPGLVSSPDELELGLYRALTDLEATGLLGPAGERLLRAPVFSVPPLLGDEIERPELSRTVRDALSHPDATAVGLFGAGGFGKSTLARTLVHDQAVRSVFPGGIAWLTVGPDAVGPDLAERVGSLVQALTGRSPRATDVVVAGARLAQVLDAMEDRFLLVLDDVWSPDQVEPFLAGSRPGTVVRLITTRNAGVVPQNSALFRVGPLAQPTARMLLTRELAGLPDDLVAEAVRLAGGMPMLLGLMNSTVRLDVSHGAEPGQALADVIAEARQDPAALDPVEPDRRSAVSATIEVAVSRLTADERARFAELSAVPAETPGEVLDRYWRVTAGWGADKGRRFRVRLVELGLAEYRQDPPTLRLDDVTHAWLRSANADRLTVRSRALVDGLRSLVRSTSNGSAWWELPRTDVFVWTWIATFLGQAGLEDELRALLVHPLFLVGKVRVAGAAALVRDLDMADHLAMVDNPTAAAIAFGLGELGPGPFADDAAVAEALYLALADVDEVREIREELARRFELSPSTPSGPAAVVVLPRLELTGSTDSVTALGVSPDGTWLASAGHDRTIRIWDMAAGTTISTVIGSDRPITALAVAPDAYWLVAATDDGRLGMWQAVDGRELRVLGEPTGLITALAVAPDGTWFASAGADGSVGIWDPVRGVARGRLVGHAGAVTAVAVSPDGTWLASAGADGQVRVWDPGTNTPVFSVDYGRPLAALTVGPDGRWLAAGQEDGRIHVLDLRTRRDQRQLSGPPGPLAAMAVDPGGRWIASAGPERLVRIRDVETGRERFRLVGSTGPVLAVAAAPDGRWVAAAGVDRVVRVWDLPPQSRR